MEDKTVSELKQVAKNRGIKGFSKMKREELLTAIATPPSLPQPLTMVMDTETTGLPNSSPHESYPPYTDVEKYDNARIVQWTWGLYDDTGKQIELIDYIIKPDGFTIPPESTAIHKISNEIASEKGVSILDAINHFLHDIARVHVIVGHNIMFDINVIKSELHRLNKKHIINAIDSKGYICTMNNSRNICKLPQTGGRAGYKYPKLSECFKYLSGVEPDATRLHNASYDVECTALCYFALLGRRK